MHIANCMKTQGEGEIPGLTVGSSVTLSDLKVKLSEVIVFLLCVGGTL